MMNSIRRLYLYAVAFISLELWLWGLIGLVRVLITAGELEAQAAWGIASVLVGGPVFLIHWQIAQGRVSHLSGERLARSRAVFLYGTLLATLLPAAFNLYALLNRLLLPAAARSSLLPLLAPTGSVSGDLIAILLNLLVAGYFYTILRNDTRHPFPDALLEARSLYRHLWLMAGIGGTVYGAQQILFYFFTLLESGRPADDRLLANGLASLLVGAPVWFIASWRIRLSLVDSEEPAPAGRAILLLGLATAAAAGTLVASGLILRDTLLALSAGNLSGYLAEISGPLSIALPLGAVWAFYGRLVGGEQRARPASPGRAALHHLPYYLLAFFGLAAIVAGLLGVFPALLAGLPQASRSGGESGWGTAAPGLAALVIGLPLWFFAWRPVALEAAEPGEAGEQARRSPVRSVYLYLILFSSVIGLLFAANALLLDLLRAGLGEPAGNWIAAALPELAAILLLSLLLGYHLRILRADSRLTQRTSARRYALYPVLILDPGDGEFTERMLAALERQAPGLPVAVHPAASGAPDESLSAAKAILLPAELAVRPSESLRLWLQAFPGMHLVVPTPAKGWHLISASGRSLQALAQGAARTVRALADGEELPNGRA
jgi:hypothetical protein